MYTYILWRYNFFSSILLTDVLLRCFTLLVPVIVLWSINYNDIKKCNFAKALSFEQKVLLPAIATCLLPFSFGWELGQDFSFLDTSIFSAIIFACLVVVSRSDKNSTSRVIMTLGAACAVFFFLASADLLNFSKVLWPGLAISLSLGVSEVGKRVRLAKVNPENNPRDEGVGFYSAGSNWSSLIFPPLLLGLSLGIDALDANVAFFYVLSHIIIWFFASDKTKTVWWVVYLINGFVLNALIYLNVRWEISFKIQPLEELAASQMEKGNLTALVMAFFALQAMIFGSAATAFFFTKREFDLLDNHVHAEKKKNCHLFFLVTGFLGAIASVFGAMFFKDIRLEKVPHVMAYFFTIQVIVLLCLARMKFLEPRGNGGAGTSMANDKPAGSETENKMQEAFYIGMAGQLSSVMVSGRWVLGVIVCLVVAAYGACLKPDDMTGWVRGVPLALVTMCGFIFNDIFDRDKDQLASVRKPIADGRLSVNAAYGYCYAFLFGAFTLELMGGGGRESLLVLAFTAAGVLLYSPTSRLFPLSKGFFTGLLTLAPFFYGASLYGVAVPKHAALSCLCFVTMREVLMDTAEVDGDLRSGIRTIGFYLGQSYGRIIAWLGMVASLVACYSIENSPISERLILASIVALLGALIYSFQNEERAIYATRVPMLLASLSVPFSFL